MKSVPDFEPYFVQFSALFCAVLNNHLAGIGGLGVVTFTIVCGQVAEFKFKLRF